MYYIMENSHCFRSCFSKKIYIYIYIIWNDKDRERMEMKKVTSTKKIHFYDINTQVLGRGIKIS